MPTWMVVEDEPDIYELLLAMFELWGIEGVAFVDGTEAVSWIEDVDQGRVRGELPQLAIIDIRLPGTEVQGPQVGARLRRSPKLKNVPIVLITAFHLSPDQQAEVMDESGADELLRKPLPSMVELRAQLDAIVAAREATAEADAAERAGDDVPASEEDEADDQHVPDVPVAPQVKTVKARNTERAADSGQGASSAPADPA